MRLLTQDDLRPLVESDEQLVRAFERLEKAILHQKHDPPDQGVSAEVPTDGNRLHRLRLTPVPDAITLRWFPVRSEPFPVANANVLMLFAPRSGELLALLSGDDLNVMRTALPTAVGVRRLAVPGARTLAILGSGRQARGHLHAYRPALPSLAEVRVYSPTPEHRERFAEEARQRYGLRVTAVNSARTAVEGADVVASLADAPTAPFETAWLQPGTLVVQLNSSGVPVDLAMVARLVVPVRNAPGEQPSGTEQAGRRPDIVHADLADILHGTAPARQHDDQIVLWDMTDPRPWDPPVANWAYKWAVEHGVGTEFNLTSTRTEIEIGG